MIVEARLYSTVYIQLSVEARVFNVIVLYIDSNNTHYSFTW